MKRETEIEDLIYLDKKEIARLKQLTIYEENARKRGFNIIAGLDEAGRGPLAGPVVAAACIIPENVYFGGINDSKLLTRPERQALFEKITNYPEIFYAIGIVEADVIDQINILQASFQAMLEALAQLSVKPNYLLVDGSMLPKVNIPAEAIVKGDSLSQSIAAASIIAKETRDRIMDAHHLKWPQYNFNKHKGYATKLHKLAIVQWGPSPIHRLSFAPFKEII